MSITGFFTFSEPETLDDEDQIAEILLEKSKKDAQEADVPALCRRKPFLFCGPGQTGPQIASDLANQFFVRTPDAIISFVTGTDLFHTWRRDDFRSAFRTGITKLLSSLDLLLIDDGLNYGLSRQIGAAVQAEEEHRTYAAKDARAEKRRPPIHYLGFVPLSKVTDADELASVQERTEDDELEVTSTVQGGRDDRLDMNRFHTHYVFANLTHEDLSFLQVDVEKQMQNEIALRQYNENRKGQTEGSSVSPVFVPHVVFLFQGGLEELSRLHNYVILRTPIIIMDGCGGMADIVAAGIRSGFLLDERHLRASLAVRLLNTFPILRQNEKLGEVYTEKLFQVIRLSASPTKIYYIVDCTRLDTFDSLDVPLLEAIIYSSAEQNAHSDQLVCNFKLCIDCNQPDIAFGILLNGVSWYHIPTKLLYGGMIAALLAPGRESFVDMLLQQQYPLRYLTSHLDLLFLFQKAAHKQLFLSLIWGDILGHHESDRIEEEFILTELNILISRLTGVRNYLDIYELSRQALTQDEDQSLFDTNRADDNSLNALIVYAVLLNRPELVIVLLKYSMDPIPIIVFVETMYRGIYRSTESLELRTGLKAHAMMFASMATDILEAGVRESPQQARTFFQRKIAAYDDKTTLEMAFDAKNRAFISHHLVQTWLDQFGNGFIRVTGTHRVLKMMLSAYLIFPMYIWLSFPKTALHKANNNSDAEYNYEPKTTEEAQLWLRDLKGSRPAADVKYAEFPPLLTMIRSVWRAPIVKFWTWFIIYVLCLVVIGIDMMMPACTHLGLDIAVFALTALIWLELVLRTIHDSLWRRRTDLQLRPFDLIYQTIFNVLFFLYRLVPYRHEHPFTGRVILAFGVMYYFNSLWLTFYVFLRKLGPLVRICMFTFKKDLPLWLLMLFPFFISAPLIWQAIITPDAPFTGDEWRKAYYRGIFSFFDSFHPMLEYDDGCVRGHQIDWSNFSQPATAEPLDRCWLGDYDISSCNTVSFWGYFFMANYYVFLKLGMMVVLAVFYIFEMPRASLIWKYYRFQTLFEYYWRSSLPFPLTIVGNIYLIFRYFTVKDRNAISPIMDPELMDLQMDTFIYWKTVATEYFIRKKQEEADRALQLKQSMELWAAKSGIHIITSHFVELEAKLQSVHEELEAKLKDTRIRKEIHLRT